MITVIAAKCQLWREKTNLSLVTDHKVSTVWRRTSWSLLSNLITIIIKCEGERSGDEIEDHSHHLLHPQKVEEDLVLEKSKINLYHCVHLCHHHSCHHSHHKLPQMPHKRWKRTWWWRSPRSSKSPTTSTLSSTSSCDRRNSTDILWLTFVYIIQFYV